MSDLDLAWMAAALEASGQYRVLRRLTPRSPRPHHGSANLRIGLFVDVETTGLDVRQDEIIELAMVPFRYGLDGTIYEVLEPFHGYRQPSRPISPLITSLTGIDDATVKGTDIALADIASFAAQAALVIAHNASFDRRVLERYSDVFRTKPWACSMSEIDWSSEGFEGTKLAYLAAGAGFYYERHRATSDCLAAIELLTLPLPRSGKTGLYRLLQSARTPRWRIWAEGAAFSVKDALKARGYKWSGDDSVPPRCWFIDVADADKDAELRFLRESIYGADVEPLMRHIGPYDRFSDRC